MRGNRRKEAQRANKRKGFCSCSNPICRSPVPSSKPFKRNTVRPINFAPLTRDWPLCFARQLFPPHSKISASLRIIEQMSSQLDAEDDASQQRDGHGSHEQLPEEEDSAVVDPLERELRAAMEEASDSGAQQLRPDSPSRSHSQHLQLQQARISDLDQAYAQHAQRNASEHPFAPESSAHAAAAAASPSSVSPPSPSLLSARWGRSFIYAFLLLLSLANLLVSLPLPDEAASCRGLSTYSLWIGILCAALVPTLHWLWPSGRERLVPPFMPFVMLAILTGTTVASLWAIVGLARDTCSDDRALRQTILADIMLVLGSAVALAFYLLLRWRFPLLQLSSMSQQVAKSSILALCAAALICDLANLAAHEPNGRMLYHWGLGVRPQSCAYQCPLPANYDPVKTIRPALCFDSVSNVVDVSLCNAGDRPKEEPCPAPVCACTGSLTPPACDPNYADYHFAVQWDAMTQAGSSVNNRYSSDFRLGSWCVMIRTNKYSERGYPIDDMPGSEYPNGWYPQQTINGIQYRYTMALGCYYSLPPPTSSSSSSTGGSWSPQSSSGPASNSSWYSSTGGSSWLNSHPDDPDTAPSSFPPGAAHPAHISPARPASSAVDIPRPRSTQEWGPPGAPIALPPRPEYSGWVSSAYCGQGGGFDNWRERQQPMAPLALPVGFTSPSEPIFIDLPPAPCPQGCAALWTSSIAFTTVFGCMVIALAISVLCNCCRKDWERCCEGCCACCGSSRGARNNAAAGGGRGVELTSASSSAEPVINPDDHSVLPSVVASPSSPVAHLSAPAPDASMRSLCVLLCRVVGVILTQGASALAPWWRHAILFVGMALLLVLSGVSCWSMLWLINANCRDFMLSAIMNACVTLLLTLGAIAVIIRNKEQVFNRERNPFESVGLLQRESTINRQVEEDELAAAGNHA